MARLLCWLGMHEWEWCGPFVFCNRPACTPVYWWTGETYWDLDVVDTRKMPRLLEVQP